jgi:hypothetical protein
MIGTTMEKFKCGHEKSPENSGWTNLKKRRGYYRCLICDKAKTAAYQKRYPERVNALQRAWRAKNPQKGAQYKRLSNYKLTPEMYQELYAKNNGCCHLCGTPDAPQKNGVSNLHIDHDHNCCSGRKTCGKCVRGLICFSCNRMIGALEKRNIKDVLTYINYKG